jgi:hypothetical protein
MQNRAVLFAPSMDKTVQSVGFEAMEMWAFLVDGEVEYRAIK